MIITIKKRIMKGLLVPIYFIAVFCVTIYSVKIISRAGEVSPLLHNSPFPLVTNRELFQPSPFEEARKFVPTLGNGELTLLLTPGDNGFMLQQLRYQLVAPNVKVHQGWPFSIGEEAYFPEIGDPWTFIVNAEGWGNWLIQADIKQLLLWDATPQFIDSYSLMFPNGVQSRTLYQVIQTDGSVIFEEVAI